MEQRGDLPDGSPSAVRPESDDYGSALDDLLEEAESLSRASTVPCDRPWRLRLSDDEMCRGGSMAASSMLSGLPRLRRDPAPSPMVGAQPSRWRTRAYM